VIGHHIFYEQYILIASLAKNPVTPTTKVFSNFYPVLAPRHFLSIINI